MRDVQSEYYEIGAYDMKYDELKKMCHKTWSDRFNYLCSDMTKIKDEGKYRIFNESKTTYLECIPKTEPFRKHITPIQTITLICINPHSFK